MGQIGEVIMVYMSGRHRTCNDGECSASKNVRRPRFGFDSKRIQDFCENRQCRRKEKHFVDRKLGNEGSGGRT